MSQPKTVTITPTSPKGAGVEFKIIDLDVLSGGVGGWNVNDVTHKKQSTSWGSVPALVYTLPLRLDGMRATGDHRSVQADFNRLWAMGNPRTTKGKTTPPAILSCTGNVKTPKAAKWVITTLTENAQIRTDDGVLVQYDVTVELTEWVKAPKKKSPASKAAAKKAAKK